MSVIPGISTDNPITTETETTLSGVLVGDSGKVRAATNAEIVTEAELTAAIQVILVGTSSYRFGKQFSEIDTTATGSWVFDGLNGFVNKLGVNNTKPTVEPVTGARANDTGYAPGQAGVSAIIGGYNNVLNSLAGFICAQHSMLYSGADHCSIFGGSVNTIGSGASYSAIIGGTSNTIEALCPYSGVYNSERVQLLTSGDINTRGHRSTVIGSTICLVRARNTTLIGCETVTVDGGYNTVLGSSTTTLGSGIRNLVCATNSTIGNLSQSSYNLIVGLQHSVNAGRSLVVGEFHTVGHSASVATGNRCRTHHAASRVHGCRHRGDIVGANQLLEWVASQETTNTNVTRLSLEGSFFFPVQPETSVVTGQVHVTGVSDAGVVSAFRIDVVVRRQTGTAAATLHTNTTTTLFNGLALPTVPTMNVTTDGIYRVQVVGLAATNIRWTATFHGNMTVY